MPRKPSHVAGIPLRKFNDPIYEALQNFNNRSNGAVLFYAPKAASLNVTPEKPNSARSETFVEHLGEKVGKLYVIAFAPFDGTGDENSYSLRNLKLSTSYPRQPKVVPRDKSATEKEVYLPMFSQLARSNATPALHAGQLDALGFKDDGKTIGAILHLGQTQEAFEKALKTGEAVKPTVQYTVGSNGETRYGDPHAIYNGYPEVVQVAGFLAIDQAASDAQRSMISELKPSTPLILG